MKDSPGFPTLLESFFTRRLIGQRSASPHTIASYRDTFRLLMYFAQKRLRKPPSQLVLSDLNAPFLETFLAGLETDRATSARSRNLRLTAIRSFFRYAALEAPQHAALIQRVLAIPNKKHPRPLVGFLIRPELDALLSAPNKNTWLGRRDHALLLTTVQTGLRAFPKSPAFAKVTSGSVLVLTSDVTEKGGKRDVHPWLGQLCACSPLGSKSKGRRIQKSYFPANAAAR